MLKLFSFVYLHAVSLLANKQNKWIQHSHNGEKANVDYELTYKELLDPNEL